LNLESLSDNNYKYNNIILSLFFWYLLNIKKENPFLKLDEEEFDELLKIFYYNIKINFYIIWNLLKDNFDYNIVKEKKHNYIKKRNDIDKVFEIIKWIKRFFNEDE